MLTLKECLDFCELTEDEVDAIAEHEHVPAIIAAELGSYLLQSNEGIDLIKRYMLEDIENAELNGRHGKAQELHEALECFNTTHSTPRIL